MAQIGKGILGNILGKVGDQRGVKSKGKFYLTPDNENTKYDFTFLQKTNHTKFGLTSRLLSPIYYQAKNIFYYKTKKGQSKFQLLNNLNKNLYGLDLIINPDKFNITQGYEPPSKVTQIVFGVEGQLVAIKMQFPNESFQLGGTKRHLPLMYRPDKNVIFQPKFLTYTPFFGFLFRYDYIPPNIPLYFWNPYQIIDTKKSSITKPVFTPNSRGVFAFPT